MAKLKLLVKIIWLKIKVFYLGMVARKQRADVARQQVKIDKLMAKKEKLDALQEEMRMILEQLEQIAKLVEDPSTDAGSILLLHRSFLAKKQNFDELCLEFDRIVGNRFKRSRKTV
jgi:hypothetical protein